MHGQKGAGCDFGNHLRSCERHLDFQSCLVDPDAWIRPVKKSGHSEQWECVPLHTKHVLATSENGEKVLREVIGKCFKLKEESIEPPQICLGGRMREVELTNGAKVWAFGSLQCVKAAVDNVEQHLAGKGTKLPKQAETPMQTQCNVLS